jgi:uncharacterized protein involved in outer membrane biogenesis
MSASVHIDPGETQTVLKLDAAVQDVELSALIRGVDRLKGVSGKFDGKLSLEAAGDDTGKLMESAAGRMVMFLADGSMPDKLATRVAGDVFTALFADFDDDDTTDIHCAIVDFDVKDGIARSRKMIMDTGAFNLYGEGEIRLDDQRVDIELVPHAKDFSLISMRLPLRIHGPFNKVKFDPEVSEGVASLLTPIELGRERDTDCMPPQLSATAGE